VYLGFANATSFIKVYTPPACRSKVMAEGGEAAVGWARQLEQETGIAPLWEVLFQLAAHPVPQVRFFDPLFIQAPTKVLAGEPRVPLRPSPLVWEVIQLAAHPRPAPSPLSSVIRATTSSFETL